MKTRSFSSGGSRIDSPESLRRFVRSGVTIVTVAASVLLTATMLAEPPWAPPVALSAPAVNAHSPAVAVSDTRTMAATWARQEGATYQVQAAIFSNGSWGQPTTLSGKGDNAFESSVAIDRSGVATVVWTIGSAVQASTFRPWAARPGWSAPVTLSEIGLSALLPRVVVDATGNLTAMWVRYDTNGVPGVEMAKCSPSGKWIAAQRIAAGAPRNLMLVMNAFGDGAAIWDIGAFTSGTTIYAATTSRFGGRGSGWSAATVVAPAAYRQGLGNIGIAANGDVTACWRINTEVRVADKLASGTWGPPTTVYSDRLLSAYPTLAVTPTGDTMAAWTTAVSTGGSYNYRIGSSVRPRNGNWTTPAYLTSSDEYDLELQAGTTTNGACVLTWVDVNSSLLKSSTWAIEKGWYDFVSIASGSDTALAVGGDTALAIWMAGSYQANVSSALIK